MTMPRETARPFRITGRHVLFAMLAFFGVVIAVNLTFVHLALSTWTGLTDHDSYRTGVSWNDTLRRDAEQRALGWTVDVDTRAAPDVAGTDDAPDGRRLSVTLTVRDRDGIPVRGLAIAGEARHPIVEADDRPIALTEVSDGIYAAELSLPGGGVWQLKLTAAGTDGREYRIDTTAAVR